MLALALVLTLTRYMTLFGRCMTLSIWKEARLAMAERGGPGGGLMAFWRGMDMAVLRTVPMQATVMLCYGACMRLLVGEAG
jgi:hypothetical protein